MHNPALVARLVFTEYGIQPADVQPLQLHTFDWRGIYRVIDAEQRGWVVRLVNQETSAQAFRGTATLLEWLRHQDYPGPQLLSTSSGRPVGHAAGWWLLVTSYIAGEQATSRPLHLQAIAGALARLHQLPVPSGTEVPMFPDSWWPAQAISDTQQLLELHLHRWPPESAPLAQSLLEALRFLQQRAAEPSVLIHGDCWPLNAIYTPQQTVLIDWDCAGRGSALLDFANLLLASHYDLQRPLEVRPDEQAIRAIVHGYAQAVRLPAVDFETLLAAQRFCLAFAAARYIARTEAAAAEDLFLRKLRARCAATAEIARHASTSAADETL